MSGDGGEGDDGRDPGCDGAGPLDAADGASHPGAPMSAAPATPAVPARGALVRLVESRAFGVLVTVAVIANAVVLGLDTYSSLPLGAHRLFERADQLFLVVFVIELALKLVAWRRRFFMSSWNVFDLAVVIISVGAAGPFTVLRALRVLRTLRLVSVVPQFRRVVEALVRAVPGIGAILGVLAVFFYVGSVLSTNLYGVAHPELFGSLGESAITLFQLMIFDGWAGDVVRTVGDTHPGSQVFFIAFTVLTGFAVLNLFIAVMVDALRAEHERLAESDLEAIEEEQKKTVREIDEVERAVERLEGKMDAMMERIETLTPTPSRGDGETP